MPIVGVAQRGDQHYAATLGRLYVDVLGPKTYLEACNRRHPNHAAANNAAFSDWSKANAAAIAEIKRRMDAYPEYWAQANRQPASVFKSRFAQLIADEKRLLERDLASYSPERSETACRKYPEIVLGPLAVLDTARRAQLETIRRGPRE